MLVQLYEHYKQNPRVTTDTRKLQQGDIFFALKGDNFNGNLYAAQALASGASLAVVDDAAAAVAGEPYLLVPDVLQALQQLALHHRQQFKIPVIAITGSNGKTTTKELVHAVLSTTYKTYTTQGNLNNHIGVPLTLLSVGADAQMIVVEMGANHQREIASYCAYTQPTHGLITNCGKAHLEGFGGVDGVRKGKGELFDFLRAHNGTAFVYRDTDYFEEMAKGLPKLVWYGKAGNFLNGTLTGAGPFLALSVNFHNDSHAEIKTQLVGGYNLPNVLAACTIGEYFGVAQHQIVDAIAAYAPNNIRSQQVISGSNTFIMDAYNANPSSMAEAIRNMAAIDHPKKILLLGSMKEMGEAERAEHEALITLLNQYAWHTVVLVGKEFLGIPHPYLHFDNNAAAREWWLKYLPTNALILVKGSRSMQMEKVVV